MRDGLHTLARLLVAAVAMAGVLLGSAVVASALSASAVAASALDENAPLKEGVGIGLDSQVAVLGPVDTTVDVVVSVAPELGATSIAVELAGGGEVVLAGSTSITVDVPSGASSVTVPVAITLPAEARGTIEVTVAVVTGAGSVASRSAQSIAVLHDNGEILAGTGGHVALDIEAFDRHAAAGMPAADAAVFRAELATVPAEALDPAADAVLRADAALRVDVAQLEPGPDEVLVEGTAFWTDENDVQRPWRFGEIEVVEDDSLSGDDVIATLTTDADGFFEVIVDNDDGFGQGGRDLFVRALSIGNGHRVETDGGQFYRVFTPTVNDVDDGSTHVFNFAAPNSNDIGNAFSVHQAMANAVPYVTDVNGGALPEVTIVYPGSGSFYTPGSNVVTLLQLDRYDWDVIHHEYGHFVADQLNLDQNPGGDHSSLQNLSEVNGKDIGTRLAFGEAWPTYFGLSLQREENLAALNVPRVGDDRYQDTEDINVDYSIEAAGIEPVGEDNEVSISRALWDAYDGPDDAGDTITLGDVAIWQRLDSINSANVSDAWQAVTGPLFPAQAAAAGCIASEWGMAPSPTAPLTGESFAMGDPVPIFEWTAGGGGPSFLNEEFIIRFWADDFATLLFESPELAATSFAPTAAQWASISARPDVRWNVTGTQPDAPETGPYLGCNRSLRFPDASAGTTSTVLIVDASGSMQTNDPQNRRLDAGNAYLNVSLRDDEVGLVQFATVPSILSEALMVGPNRETLRSAVNNIGSSGGTDLGGGIAAGCEVLGRAGGGQKAAILLTDGVGSYTNEADCFASQGWRIHVFGLSDNVDRALLEQIAGATGGTYTQLDQVTNLVCEFQQIRSVIAGGVRSDCQPTATINPGQRIQLTETVTQLLRQITFTNIWDGSDIEMTVTAPDGRTIDRNTVGPDVVVDVGPTFETFTVSNPDRGDWEIELFGADVPPEGEEFTFSTVRLPVDGGPGPDVYTCGTVSGTRDQLEAMGYNVVIGTEGKDNLQLSGGGDRPDFVLGLGGNDTIRTGRGDDVVCGGDGNDLITLGRGADVAFGQGGKDRIFGDGGSDIIDGGDERDIIHGGADGDVISAGAGDDFVTGGRGDDVLHGSDGKDILSGGTGDDELNGEGGDDRLYGNGGSDSLSGGDDADRCIGGPQADVADDTCEITDVLP